MSNIWHVCKRSYEDGDADLKQKLRAELTAWGQQKKHELELSTQAEFMGCYYLYASKRLWRESRDQEHIWNTLNNQHTQALTLFIDSGSKLELDSYGERLVELMKYLVLKSKSQENIFDQIRWWIPSHLKCKDIKHMELDSDLKERIHGLQST